MGDELIKENQLPSRIENVYYHSFTSGLANRMRAWITTSAFAEYMNVPYIMKWRVDDAINNTFFHELFEVPNNMQYLFDKSFEPNSTTFWIKRNYPNNSFHDNFIEGNFNLSKKEFQKIVDNQKRYINPLPHIQKKFELLKNKLNIENCIGLHIRRTDLKEQHLTTDAWFEDNIQAEISKNKNVNFFLATDNEYTEKKFTSKYSNYIKITERNFDNNKCGEVYPGGSRYRHSSIENALLDMMLLGCTQKVYGCYGSSFGRLGAWMGKKKFIIPNARNLN